MTFFIWSISSFKCGTVREVVPRNWIPISIFSLSSWLYVCPPPSRSSRACLLRLISILNSWFWQVNSAIAAAIDCTCWADDVGMAGADWGPWWRLLEAFLLRWRLGLVALDLVRTINLLSQKRKLQKNFLAIPHRRRQLIVPQKSVGWWVLYTDDLEAWSWKQITSQRGPVGTGQRSSDGEVSKLVIFDRGRDLFWKNKCLNALPLRGRMLILHTWNGYITVPLVQEFITAVEVMILEPAFHKQL